MPEAIKFTHSDGVISISLNRPPANAYDLGFQGELNEALREADHCDGANAIVLGSKLEKFFCAGADIKAFQKNSISENEKMVEQARANLQIIETSEKVFIAAIAGHCLGGGLELALACDFRFGADKEFLIGLPEIKLGLMPGNGGSQRLTKRVGINHALELLLTGDSITPQRAKEIGLFNDLFPANELTASCLGFARKLAKGPGLALGATKKAVYDGFPLPLSEALQLEQSLVNALYDTADAKEGMLAFLEKRDPNFTGR